MISFTEILACDGTVLYSINKSEMDFVTSGQLQVLIALDGMILLKINDFEYGVNPTDQILYDEKDPQFSMILYMKKYPEGQWVLKINEHSDEVFSCLNEKCYLKNKQSKQQTNYSYSTSKSNEKV